MRENEKCKDTVRMRRCQLVNGFFVEAGGCSGHKAPGAPCGGTKRRLTTKGHEGPRREHEMLLKGFHRGCLRHKFTRINGIGWARRHEGMKRRITRGPGDQDVDIRITGEEETEGGGFD